MQICLENCGIQPVALETATQEERAATPQYRADDRHVEIDAGSDVRDAQTLAVNDVAEQQVVEVTAMARHVNDTAVACEIVQAVHVRKLNTVVDLVPHPAQESRHQPDRLVRLVGRNLMCIFPRFLRGAFELHAAVTGLRLDNLPHRRIEHDLVHERASMRKVGAHRRGTPLAEVDAEDTGHLAIRNRGIEAVLHDRA